VIDHDVVGLDVSMHDPLRMGEVESFQEFEHVEAYIKVGEFGIEGFEFGVLGLCKRRTSAWT